MRITKKTVEKEIKKIVKITPEDARWSTYLFLLSSAVVGPNIKKIKKFSGLPLASVQKFSKIAHKNKIFVGNKLAVEWFEKNGGIALIADGMVLDGLLERVTK